MDPHLERCCSNKQARAQVLSLDSSAWMDSDWRSESLSPEHCTESSAGKIDMEVEVRLLVLLAREGM